MVYSELLNRDKKLNEGKTIHIICHHSPKTYDGGTYSRLDEAHLDIENARKRLEILNNNGGYHFIVTIPFKG